MIAVITTPHWGDLLMLGALIVGFFWLGYLGVQAIKLWIELMRLVQHGKRSLERGPRKAEYADFDAEPADDDTEALADSLRYPDLDEDQVSDEAYGNHAAVPPPTTVETTGFMPRVNVLPVDDDAALRVVQSLSGDGAR